MAQPPDPPPESAAARPGRPAPAPGHPCPAAPRLQRLRARWPPGRAPARPLRRGSRLPPATPARNTDARRTSVASPGCFIVDTCGQPRQMRRPSCISARNFGYRLDFVARQNRSSATPARAVDPVTTWRVSLADATTPVWPSSADGQTMTRPSRPGTSDRCPRQRRYHRPAPGPRTGTASDRSV